MVALPRMRGDFHFTQERVHLGDRQDPPGADRAVARHRRRDMVEPFAQRQRLVERGEFVGEIGDEPGHVALPEHCGHAAHQHRMRAEAVEIEAEFAELGRARFEPIASRFVEFDHFGEEQRLAGDAAARHRLAHPFEHEPFVRGVLIDEDQPVWALGDDIGFRDLAAGDAEREVDRLGRGCVGGFGARLRRRGEDTAALVERVRTLIQ